MATGADRNDKAGAHNAALVALDPKTGQILAMVGSRDYFKDQFQKDVIRVNCQFEGNVNVVTRSRQPGSSFKPFVYATAFKKGYTDKTILLIYQHSLIQDVIRRAGTISQGAKCYAPRDFDFKYRGA